MQAVKSKKQLRVRRTRGALTIEYWMTMYVLFLFIIYPLLNYGVLGMRAFFLWFAANQAAMVGSQQRTLITPVTVGTTLFPGAYAVAQGRANEIGRIFPGIHWPAGDPQVYVLVTLINGQTPMAPDPAASSPYHITGTALLPPAPDPASYICTFKVVINGWIDPLITVPWFNVPGLSKPAYITVSSEAQFENVPGLTE